MLAKRHNYAFTLFILSNTCSYYGIYSTRIANGPECQIRKKDHQIKTVDTLLGDSRLKLIYSPGIELITPVQ